MKKIFIALLAVSMLVFSSAFVLAGKKSCTTIQSGELYTTDGRVITTGYDEWGYNYQGHMFKGGYCDAYRDAAWCQPYKDIKLIMKWNDAWLSNKDCDEDGLLDRHNGYDSYIGSGAWETNHMYGTYEKDSKTCKWNSFVKIVAKPSSDYSCEDNGGVEIWGAFCKIMSVYNDPCEGLNGLEFKADVLGFGYY